MRFPLAGSIITAVAQPGMLAGAESADVVSPRLQLVVDRLRHIGFDIQLVEACRMRPERSVEVQRLDARPLERLVQVRIPVVPELDDAQERLQDRLLLVVAAGRADAPSTASPLKTMLGVSV